MALSAAHKEAYARAQVDVRHLMALTLSHSTFGDRRFVNYTSDISVDGSTYYAIAMDIREPPVSTESANTVSIKMDGVSGLIQPLLYDAGQVPEPVYVTLKPFGYNITSGSTLGVVGTLNLELQSASITAEQVVIEAGFSNSNNEKFPSIRYTSDSHPGIY